MDRNRFPWRARDIVDNRPLPSRWHPDHASDFERFEE